MSRGSGFLNHRIFFDIVVMCGPLELNKIFPFLLTRWSAFVCRLSAGSCAAFLSKFSRSCQTVFVRHRSTVPGFFSVQLCTDCAVVKKFVQL